MSGGLDCYYDPSDGERYPHKWGYTDTRFEFDGPKSVRVTGRRYPLAGMSLPEFVAILRMTLRPRMIGFLVRALFRGGFRARTQGAE